MAKFKVGDIVIGNEKNKYGITCKGAKCEVVKVYGQGYDLIRVKLLHSGDQDFPVDPKYFDLVIDEKITITRYGDKVVAKYGKKAGVAKCSPDDTFDFAVGAKLAFKRLMGEPEDKPEPKQEFIKGEFVKVVGNSKHNHHFTIGTIVKIIKRFSIDSWKCFGLGYNSNLEYEFIDQYVSSDDIEHLSENTHAD